MDYRHEWKHQISLSDVMTLRQRLSAVMRPDPHAPGGRYAIRSLYFDTPGDRCLREKLDGVDRREKFRLRCYNGDHSLIHLEKKSKRAGLGTKQIAAVTAEETARLLSGDLSWMPGSGRALVAELYSKMRGELLRPKTLVDYEREPFVYSPGNVRVTLDCHIRTALCSTAFLDPRCPTVPIPGDPILLEVKWDAFLPDVIRRAVALEARHASAFSKYAACRTYD